MIELADSHGHLTMIFPGPEARWPTRTATDDEVAELVARARDAGVTQILVPVTTLEDAPRAVEVAERFDGVYAAVGVHPHETKAFDEDRVIPALERLVASKKVVAIGEIGLGYFYDFGPKEDHRSGALVAQLRLANGSARAGSPPHTASRRSANLLSILEVEAKGESGRSLRGVFQLRSARRSRQGEGNRPRLPRQLLGDDHVPHGGERPRKNRRPPAGSDARRDRCALPRSGPLSRQVERACLRGAHGGEAG